MRDNPFSAQEPVAALWNVNWRLTLRFQGFSDLSQAPVVLILVLYCYFSQYKCSIDSVMFFHAELHFPLLKVLLANVSFQRLPLQLHDGYFIKCFKK